MEVWLREYETAAKRISRTDSAISNQFIRLAMDLLEETREIPSCPMKANKMTEMLISSLFKKEDIDTTLIANTSVTRIEESKSQLAPKNIEKSQPTPQQPPKE
jgi:hypothetical protein